MRKVRPLSTLLLAIATLAAMTAAASDVRDVRIEDECDRNTFPPEAGCVGNGNVTFQEFLATLNPAIGGHRKWAFHFGRGRLDAGESMRVVNEGGEPHSFTEVVSYGTGVVPPLNGGYTLGRSPSAASGWSSRPRSGSWPPSRSGWRRSCSIAATPCSRLRAAWGSGPPRR